MLRARAAAPRSAPGVLPRSRPASSTICSGRSPTDSARRARSTQERGDVGDEIVVVRIGIGDARPQADVGGDHGGVVLGRDPEIVGVVEPGDVVADDRAGRARGVEHRGAPRVDRERHVESGPQRLDRGHDPVELLVLVDLGPGPGLDPADVEQVGAVGDELLRPPHERVEVPGRAPVVERIGGAVQDPHHDDAAAHVDGALTQPQGRERLDGHGGRLPTRPRRRAR